jgi:hypothetical protein
MLFIRGRYSLRESIINGGLASMFDSTDATGLKYYVRHGRDMASRRNLWHSQDL